MGLSKEGRTWHHEVTKQEPDMQKVCRGCQFTDMETNCQWNDMQLLVLSETDSVLWRKAKPGFVRRMRCMLKHGMHHNGSRFNVCIVLHSAAMSWVDLSCWNSFDRSVGRFTTELRGCWILRDWEHCSRSKTSLWIFLSNSFGSLCRGRGGAFELHKGCTATTISGAGVLGTVGCLHFVG